MELSDKAFSTLTALRNATWLNSDKEIEVACQEVARYLQEVATYTQTEELPQRKREDTDAAIKQRNTFS